MKKLFPLMLALILMLSLALPSLTMANGNGECAAMTVPVGQHIDRARIATLCRMVDAANAQIEFLVEIAQFTPWNDINWLIASTNAIVENVMRYARYIGAEVECTYTEYFIDGQWVLIDPLKVIDPDNYGKK